ncbi:MAG: thioredoxin-dependent thiol peroxidase [Candidatus Limnocylindrus sp.]|jgi:peroxiredoxin Q/BCP
MSELGDHPSVGTPAPDFTLRDADGIERKRADAAGSWLVLYFYPKDDTPGCTIEACEFRDADADLQRAGAVVWGVSPDGQESKAAFREKFSLNFPILSDPDHVVAEAYGAWGEREMLGKTVQTVHRITLLIAPDGTVARVWPKVTPTGHAAEVLAEITARS